MAPIPVTAHLDSREDQPGLRGEHGTRDRAPLRDGTGSAAHAGGARRRPRELLLGSIGERRRWRRRGLLEEVARMAYDTVALNAAAEPIPPSLLDKHFLRKHGPGAYYGQPRKD